MSTMGPDVRFTRNAMSPPPVEGVIEASARALDLARDIERILDAAKDGATTREVYALRLAQAICTSLQQELEAISQPESRGPRSVRATRVVTGSGE